MMFCLGLFGGPKLQSRWCALHAGVFYYYTKPEDKKQCGAFRVEGRLTAEKKIPN